MPKSPKDDPELNATRSSLLRRLRNWEDQESWRDFFDTYWKLIYSVAIKCGLNDADARDVVQETALSAAKNLQQGKFKIGEGSFRTWLLQITRRRIADHFRSRKSELKGRTKDEADTSDTPTIERVAAPSDDQLTTLWDEEWSRNLAEMALQHVRQRVGVKQYQMFDLYVVKQWPVSEVARTLHVNAAQVYLAKHRVTFLANQEVRRLEKAAERAGTQAFHQLKLQPPQ